MSKSMIAFFEELGMEDVNKVGGKCASLGEMTKIGVPVPPGFAVTTAAFSYFLDQTHAFDDLMKCSAMFSDEPSTMDEFNKMEKAFQEIILEKELPSEISAAVSKAYEDLCKQCGIKDMPVAVRSSGVSEDSPTASFAGQYESYLNVKGKDEVLAKLHECWASMFTARGISYRIRQKMPIIEGGMSVAVMKMVKSKASGVAFTLIPSTQDASKIFLEANFGVGESVVQGIVNPDQITIVKEGLKIEKKVVNKKLRQYSLKENGTEEEDIPEELQDICCINDDEITTLASYFMLIDKHYMVPMDIEWAIDKDLTYPQNVFLVQARPVTIKAKQKPASKLFMEMFLDFCHDGLKGKKILVVDDEPDILDSVAEILETSDVHKAADFEIANQYLKTETYDIVVLDIMGVNGFELLKTSVERGFPAVMLTAHALSRDALAKATELGASGFIPKEKITKLKGFLEVALMDGDEAAWREIADQFEPLFNKLFGLDWKKVVGM